MKAALRRCRPGAGTRSALQAVGRWGWIIGLSLAVAVAFDAFPGRTLHAQSDAANPAPGDGTTEAATEDVAALFAHVERAWTAGQADALVDRFGSGKVLLSLPDNPQAARRYSHQQSLLILRDHFAVHETRFFDFIRTQTPEASQGRAIGLAAVTWRPRGSGRTREGRILMVLEREGGRWGLTEVLALP